MSTPISTNALKTLFPDGHPQYTREAWKVKVSSDSTSLGYEPWVLSMLERAVEGGSKQAGAELHQLTETVSLMANPFWGNPVFDRLQTIGDQARFSCDYARTGQWFGHWMAVEPALESMRVTFSTAQKFEADASPSRVLSASVVLTPLAGSPDHVVARVAALTSDVARDFDEQAHALAGHLFDEGADALEETFTVMRADIAHLLDPQASPEQGWAVAQLCFDLPDYIKNFSMEEALASLSAPQALQSTDATMTLGAERYINRVYALAAARNETASDSTEAGQAPAP